MSQIKKKLNVIRPTLRHKKRYIKITYLKNNDFDPYLVISKNYEKIHGLFSLLESNLTVMESDLAKKIIIIRINNDFKSNFLSSLFFLKQDLGLIFILKEGSTLNSLK